MKQSHNALTYLRAQYNAIYGRAYVKGLATAMVVTSALASSMAQAATTDNGTNTSNDGSQAQPHRADASASLTSANFDPNKVARAKGVTATELVAGNAADIYLSQQIEQTNIMLASDDTATPKADKPTSPNHEWGQGGFMGNTTTLTGEGGFNHSYWYEKLNLASDDKGNADITISSYNSGSQNYENFTHFIVGSSSNNEDNQIKSNSVSKLTIKDNAALQINAAGGTNNLEGSVVFDAQGVGSQAIINVGMTKDGDEPSNAKLNLGSSGDNGGTITVNAGSGTAAIYAPNVNFKGNVEVKDGANLLLNGAITNGDKLSQDSAYHSAGKFTVDNGVSLNIGESGSITVAKADKGHTVLDLSSGSVSGTGTLEVQGTAILSAGVLDDFIAKSSADDDTVSGGNVTLASGGRLELDGNVDLQSYTFSKIRGEGKKINVLDGDVANVITGKALTLTGRLHDEDLNLNLESTTLNLGGGTNFNSADQTLGYKNAYTKDVKFSQDDLGNGVKQDFHLTSGVTLDGLTKTQRESGNLDSPTSGSITGNVVVKGGGNVYGNDLNGAFRVVQGDYTNNNNITLDGGTLAVGALTNDEKAKDGEERGKYSHDASLKLGAGSTLKIDNTNSGNYIKVASNNPDTNAILDLSKGNLNIAYGDKVSIIQIGEAGSVNGVDFVDGTGRSKIELTDDQYKQIFRDENNRSGNGVNVVLAGNGVMQAQDPTLKSSDLQKITQLSDPRLQNTTDKLYFYEGGRLEGNNLTVNNDDTALDIGKGTIVASNINVEQKGNNSGDFIIKSGNIETSNLTSSGSTVSKIQIGGNGGPESGERAAVTLVGNDTPQDFDLDFDIEVNVTNANGGDSSLTFKNGKWNVDNSTNQHHITLNGPKASLNIGGRGSNNADVTFKGLNISGGGAVNIAKDSDLRLRGKNDLSSGNLAGSGDLYLTSGSDTTLNQSSLNNFFVKTGADDPDNKQDGGRVILQGGTLDLRATGNESINLNAYKQGSAEGDSGDLIITADSTIKSNNITVNKKLHDDWNDRVKFDVDTLHLGGAEDTTPSTHSLNFKEATVHQNVSFDQTTITDADGNSTTKDFNLRNKLIIDGEGNGASGAVAAQGNVHIHQLSGSTDPTIQVLTGNVTHQSATTDPAQFDLQGASLQIGGGTDSGSRGHDARLGFNNVNVTFGDGSAINITSNGNDGRSTFDLTGAKSVTTSGASSITVGTDLATASGNGNTIGKQHSDLGLIPDGDTEFTIYDTQLNQLFKSDADGLRSGSDGMKVVLGQTGVMQIKSDPNAADGAKKSLDISFLAEANTNTPNTLDGNKIHFNNGGLLKAESLELTQNNATTDSNLNIGSGAISVDDLTLTNKYNDGSGNFVVENGTLEVKNSLAGNKLQLGTGTSTSKATLNLGRFDATLEDTDNDGVTDAITASNATVSGTVGTNVLLNGNAELNVNAGTWDLNNVESSGSGNTINVGFVSKSGGLVPQLNGSDLTAEVTADKFHVGNGNNLNINQNGTATFSDYANELGGTTVINGKLVIADEGKGDFLSGDISGTGELEVKGTALLNQAFLTNFNTGKVTLNAGEADFTQSGDGNVDISDLTFTEDDAQKANFNIIAKRDTSGAATVTASVLRGNDVTIGQALASGNQVNLDIHAKKAILGGTDGFTSADTNFGYHQLVAQNAEFKADKATNTDLTLRDGITFVATENTGTTDKPVYEADTGTSTGNVIVKGGTANDFNSFNVAAGEITHSGNITLDGGEILIGSTEGTRTNLTGDYSVDGVDASLVMATGSQLVINNKNSSNAIKILGNGSGAQSSLDLSKIPVDLNRDDTGSNFTTITVGGGDQDLHAKNDALLKLSDSSALLDLNNPDAKGGIGVVLTGNGALKMVSSDATKPAVLDVKNIDGFTKTPTSDKIIFSGGGMIIGENFKVTNQDATDTGKDLGIDLGYGTIKAENLTFENAQKYAVLDENGDPVNDTDGNPITKNADLILNSGKVIVGTSLTSNSGKIQIGQKPSSTTTPPVTRNRAAYAPSTDTPAELHLGYFMTKTIEGTAADGSAVTYEVADANLLSKGSDGKGKGIVTSDIVVTGNVAKDAEFNISLDALNKGQIKGTTTASLHVDYGDWTVNKLDNGSTATIADVADNTKTGIDASKKTGTGDVTIEDGAILEIGAVDKNGTAYKIDDGRTLGAILRGDELTIDHAGMIVHQNGQAYFNKFTTPNGSITINRGYMEIGGVGSGSSGGSGGDSGNDSGYYEIDGRDALTVFNDINENSIITLNPDDNTVTIDKKLANQFVISNGGTLALEMGEDQDFSLEQIQSLRKQLLTKLDYDTIVPDPDHPDIIKYKKVPLTDDEAKVAIDGGYIDARKATTSAVAVDDSSGRNVIDYGTESGNLALIKDMIFSNVSTSTLTNVNASDALDVGTVGNLETNAGDTFIATDVDLTDATGSDYIMGGAKGKYFAVSQDGHILNAQVTSGGHLGLHNGGKIGAITLENGISGADGKFTETELLIKSASGATTYITSISGGSGSFMGIYGQHHDGVADAGEVVIGSEGQSTSTVNIDTLDVNGNLTVYGKLTVDKKLTSSLSGVYGLDNQIYVNELNVKGNTVDFDQELQVQTSASFGSNSGSETTLMNTTKIKGNATFTGTTTLGATSTTNIDKDAEFNGTTNLLGQLDVKGSTTFTGDVQQKEGSTFTALSNNSVTFDARGSSNVSHLNGTNELNNANKVKFQNDGENNKHVIGGTFNATEVTVDGTLQIAGQDAIATIITNLYGTDENTVVQVGNDKKEPGSHPSGDSGDYGDALTGQLVVTNIDLKGGTFYVDPDYGKPASLVAFENVENGIGGDLVVGKNSAIGLGGSLADLQNAVAQYQDKQTKSLKSDVYGAILAVNKPITVKDGQYIAVTSLEEQDALEKINEWRGDNDFILSDNAALIVNLDTLNDGKAKADSIPTAITFEKSNAKVKSEGGDLVLAGNFDATKQVQIFQDADNNGVMIEGESINVVTPSNRFKAVLAAGESNGLVKFDYQKPNGGNSNNPVDDLIEDNFNNGQNQNNGNNAANNGNGENNNGGSGNGGSNNGYNEDLQLIAQNSPDTADRLSRAAVMGAVPQVALRVGQTTSDAMMDRMNAPRSVTVTDQGTIANNPDGGVWINPVYVKSDSDGFNSQGGISYGHDIDITGVAVGAEKFLGSNVKVGVVANVGKGSAKGKASAQNVKNDFDYYGGGIYLGYQGASSSVMADVSYTAVKNDLNFNEPDRSYKTDTDSYNLSAGVTGQTTFSLGGLDVTPHLGVRYSRIHLDDINFKNAGNDKFLGVHSKDINLLSVPVGVKFSTDMQFDNWTVKPSLDLTATGNFGDTKIDDSANWANLDAVGLESEFVDKFTYGAKAGLEVTNGNFSFGLKAGYTGSKHTDEFNVGADVRYDF